MKRKAAIKYDKIFAALSCTYLTQPGSYDMYTPRIKRKHVSKALLFISNNN